jgi:hypothetical protein
MQRPIMFFVRSQCRDAAREVSSHAPFRADGRYNLLQVAVAEICALRRQDVYTANLRGISRAL